MEGNDATSDLSESSFQVESEINSSNGESETNCESDDSEECNSSLSEESSDKEGNDTERDTDQGEESANADQQVTQASHMSTGESHIITAPSGRRFIAHIYEQGANGQPNPVQIQQGDQGEGNMARTLCLNLLNELVKGSYQMIMYKKKKDVDDGSENEAQEDGPSGINVNAPDRADSKDVSPENEIQDSIGFEEEEDSNEPPFKKAKYGWQIKNNTEASCSSEDVSNSAVMEKETGNSEDCQMDTFDADNHSSACIQEDNVSNSQDSNSQVASEEDTLSSPINIPKWKPSVQQTELKIPSAIVSNQDTLQRSTSDELPNETASLGNVDRVKAQLVQKMVELQRRNCTSSSSVTSSNTDGSGNPASLHVHDILTGSQDNDQQQSSASVNSSSENSAQEDSSHRASDPAPPATYLERWQSHHIAKSIVDNAINRTIEEMGLSPDAAQNATQSQRRTIEDVGVAQVIRDRGLHGVDRSGSLPTLQRQPQDEDRTRSGQNANSQRLNPIISRLTQVSENIFVQNIQHGLRLSARIDLGAFNQNNQTQQNNPRTDSTDQREGRNQTVVPTATTNQQANGSLAIDINNVSLMNDSTVSDSENRDSCKEQLDGEDIVSTNQVNTSEILSPSKRDKGEKASRVNMSSTSDSDDENIRKEQTSDCHVLKLSRMPGPDDLEELKQQALSEIDKFDADSPSTSFILDHALNAAISEKGLHFE